MADGSPGSRRAPRLVQANRVDGRRVTTGEQETAVRPRRLELPALAALLAFCTLWRLPGLADPPWINDEGVYATVGKAIMQGEALYRQVWENKPPGIYLLFGVTHLLVGPAHLLFSVRMLALVAALITQSAVYGLLRTQHCRLTALLATAVAGLLIDLPLLDGPEANAEIFLIAGTSSAMVLLWRGLAEQRPAAVAVPAGMALGLAVLLKLVAGADVLAALLLLLGWRAVPLAARLRAIALLLVGLALPLAAVAGWLISRGLLGDALYATVGYNRGYVATGQTEHAAIVSILTLVVPLALLLCGLYLYLSHPAQAFMGAWASVWLALALTGALASGRSYPHYFLQAVPPLAVALALACEAWCVGGRASGGAGSRGLEIPARRLRRVLWSLLVAWTVLVPAASFAALAHEAPHAAPGSDQVGYYGHFWLYLTGRLQPTAYGNDMDPRVERNVAVAKYLAAHPLAPRRVYVWGNAPWIYYLSGYEHAARFLSAYYNPPIPGGMAQTLRQLQREPPPYVVVIEPPTPADAGIAHFLAQRYHAVRRIDNAVVYRLDGAGPR